MTAHSRTEQVHVENLVKVGKRALGKTCIAQDAGVVDEDVHPTPALDRARDHVRDLRGVAHVGAVRDRCTAGRDDLVRDALRRLGRATRTVHVAAEVVDDDLGAPRRQGQRVRAAQAGARTGNDGDATVETYTHDRGRPVSLISQVTNSAGGPMSTWEQASP